MEEVKDEPLFAERVAGTGIGKAAVMVTIRVPGDARPGRRQQETREFRGRPQGPAGAGGLAAVLAGH